MHATWYTLQIVGAVLILLAAEPILSGKLFMHILKILVLSMLQEPISRKNKCLPRLSLHQLHLTVHLHYIVGANAFIIANLYRHKIQLPVSCCFLSSSSS